MRRSWFAVLLVAGCGNSPGVDAPASPTPTQTPCPIGEAWTCAGASLIADSPGECRFRTGCYTTPGEGVEALLIRCTTNSATGNPANCECVREDGTVDGSWVEWNYSVCGGVGGNLAPTSCLAAQHCGWHMPPSFL